MGSESLWAECKTCQKQIASSAKSCPHCGARQSRFTSAKWIGVGFVVIGFLAAIAGRDKAAEDPVQSNQTAAAATAQSSVSIPERQGMFLDVTEAYSDRFLSASNELQQSVLRDERRNALLGALGSDPSISGWRGTISRLKTNTDGNAILSVRLSPNTTVGTWNNAFSDITDGTLIGKGTTLYATLMTMSVGEEVTVSGTFLPSDEDGIRETSVTIRGSMTAPEFLFRFHNISKQ